MENKIKNTSTNNEIDYASIEALTAVNNLMQALNKANDKLIEKHATREQELVDRKEYSANSICINKLLEARAIIIQISNNCLDIHLNKYSK